jgi:hypothetical protein
MYNYLTSGRLEDIKSHQWRNTKYARVDLLTLYYLLEKYREPPGLTMLELSVRICCFCSSFLVVFC